MKYRFAIVLFFLFCFAPNAFSQHTLSGTVVDSVTGTPLAFVNIITNNGLNGTSTDIDGKFTIKSNYQIKHLKISYVGYQAKIVNTETVKEAVTINLVRKEIELKGVEVFPGENPANRIIRKVIANRKLNDPEAIPEFKYNSYNKVTAEYYLDQTKYTINSDPESALKNDSTFLRLSHQAEEQYIMMMESNTERIYLNGKSKETILGTKVSGFTDPNFSSLATDIQPFSFYKDFVSLSITDIKDYLNPIANGSIGRYYYLIEDTIFENQDSVFVVSFKPESGKNFNGLKGVLYISSNLYALKGVIAEPAVEALWSIKIQQLYVFTDNKYWFPSQLNYDWVLPNYPSEKVGLILHGRSYITNVDFNAVIKNSDFGPSNLIFEKGAGTHDSTYWKMQRKDTLTQKEMVTYQKLDSLGKKTHFDYIAKLTEKILDGYIPISIFDVNLEYLLALNNIEGLRVGLGLRTNEKVLHWASIGGFFGYGIWDKTRKWKYGGHVEFTLSKKHEIKIGFNYSKDIENPGNTDLYRYNNSTYWSSFIVDNIDFNEKFNAHFTFRTLRYLQVSLSTTKESVTPEYSYYYLPTVGDTFANNTYHFTEVNLGLRYAYKEKLIDAFNQRYSMGTNYPVVYLTYIHGFKDVLGGQFNYDKAEFGIEKNFLIKHFGKTSLYAEAGYIWGSVPYSKLFKGKGTYSSSFMFYFRNTFQTMGVDEFIYDRYIMMFASHNFGSNLFHIGNFRPELRLCQGVLYGTLSNSSFHTGNDIGYQVPDKWFFESGLILDNLFRLKIFNLVYLKIGAGGFYRYGYYNRKDPDDNTTQQFFNNIAFKLSLKISGSK
ncbi:MAG: DUF5686 family protein [Bacteroidota bacterium]